MDIRFVETLLLVCEDGSLAAAARRQGLTPAAITQRIATLEAQLQVALLIRVGRRMRPTPECEALLPELRKLCRIQRGLRQVLAQQDMLGPFRLGAISTALGDHAADLLCCFEAQAPQVELTLVPGSSVKLYEAFQQGRLEAVLLVRPPFDLPKTMRFDPLSRQQIGLLQPQQAAADLPFLLYDRQAWGGAACHQLLQRHCPDAAVLCEMDALECIAQLVADGVGQAIVPQWRGLQRFLADCQFTPWPDCHRDLGLLRWQQDLRRPVQQLLHKALQPSG